MVPHWELGSSDTFILEGSCTQRDSVACHSLSRTRQFDDNLGGRSVHSCVQIIGLQYSGSTQTASNFHLIASTRTRSHLNGSWSILQAKVLPKNQFTSEMTMNFLSVQAAQCRKITCCGKQVLPKQGNQRFYLIISPSSPAGHPRIALPVFNAFKAKAWIECDARNKYNVYYTFGLIDVDHITLNDLFYLKTPLLIGRFGLETNIVWTMTWLTLWDNLSYNKSL